MKRPWYRSISDRKLFHLHKLPGGERLCGNGGPVIHEDALGFSAELIRRDLRNRGGLYCFRCEARFWEAESASSD